MIKILRFLCVSSLLVVTSVHSQEYTTDRINFGREWKSWSDILRLVYIEGFKDGQSNTYIAVFNHLNQESREALRKQTFLFYDSDTIRDVMTDLYKDPANTFIRYGAMVYIARDKLSGKDIEPMLRYAREHELAFSRPPK